MHALPPTIHLLPWRAALRAERQTAGQQARRAVMRVLFNMLSIIAAVITMLVVITSGMIAWLRVLQFRPVQEGIRQTDIQMQTLTQTCGQ